MGIRDNGGTINFIFFQADDGIRDQPRSRGLGDVYTRQIKKWGRTLHHLLDLFRGQMWENPL